MGSGGFNGKNGQSSSRRVPVDLKERPSFVRQATGITPGRVHSTGNVCSAELFAMLWWFGLRHLSPEVRTPTPWEATSVASSSNQDQQMRERPSPPEANKAPLDVVEDGSYSIPNAPKTSRNVRLELRLGVLNALAGDLVSTPPVEPNGSLPSVLALLVLVAATDKLPGGHDPHDLHSFGIEHKPVVVPLRRVIDGGNSAASPGITSRERALICTNAAEPSGRRTRASTASSSTRGRWTSSPSFSIRPTIQYSIRLPKAARDRKDFLATHPKVPTRSSCINYGADGGTAKAIRTV